MDLREHERGTSAKENVEPLGHALIAGREGVHKVPSRTDELILIKSFDQCDKRESRVRRWKSALTPHRVTRRRTRPTAPKPKHKPPAYIFPLPPLQGSRCVWMPRVI